MTHPATEVFMYHHTHWDREWWTTFERFRFRLVHTVDRLLDLLDADDTFTDFVLDGQTIVLEDYLQIRPENRERLVARIREGRIHVGPWHILPDEFLVSGEATIRNLWLGERTARRYGVRTSRVGYLPDQFGHIAQMPQVLAGFGLDSAVVWRGFGAPPKGRAAGEGDIGGDHYAFPRARNAAAFPAETQSEFWWEAPDGSRVLGVYLPLEYYRSHYLVRPEDPELTHDQTVGRARRFVNYLRAYATGTEILEPMGGDHLPVDGRLPRLLRDLNAQLEPDGIRYRLASLEDFVAAVRAREDSVSVVWRGEGRAFGRKAHLLPGVLSTRLYLKRLNWEAQTALERHAEPLQALNWMLGARYEREFLWHAWERLVQNHPHDSICGCSTDQVHREMIPRFDEATQVARLLAETALQDVAARLEPGPAGPGAQPVVAFNPLGWARTDEVLVRLNPYLEVSPDAWRLLGPDGAEVAFQTRQVAETLDKFENYAWLGAARVRDHTDDECTEVSFVARDLPPLGYRAYRLERRDGPRLESRVRRHTVAGTPARDKGAAETTGLRIGPGLLENEHLRVEVSPEDGTVTLTDLETGLVYPGLNAFDDGGDAGDTYNYSAPLGDQVLGTAGVRPRLGVVEAGPARCTLRVTWPWALPEGLTPDRDARSSQYVPLELHSDLTLLAGVKRLDVRVHFTNTARDHRLRALLPLGAAVAVSSAEGQFCVVDRPVALPEGERGSAEPAVPEHPQTGFVSVSGAGRGLTVANRGLPEFSVLEDGRGTVALTVLRAVGWLSREDILARVGGAGPTTRTPEAQSLGPVSAEYSLIPHAGAWHEAGPHRAAHDFGAPLLAATLVPQTMEMRPERPAFPRSLPPEGSLLAVTGDVVLSALKKAEDAEALVVRVLNEGHRPATATLTPARRPVRATLADLRELPVAGGELEVRPDGSVTLEVAPWRLATVLLDYTEEARA